MSNYIATGFSIHFIQDIMDRIKTDNEILNFIITIGCFLLMNRDFRMYLKELIDVKNFKETYCSCFQKKIEYSLSSVRKSNYDGDYTTCPKKILAWAHYCNKRIGTGELDFSNISRLEELIINENDGYSDDVSIAVPVGKIKIGDIIVKCTLNDKEQDEKHGKKIEYKQVNISIIGKDYKAINDFIDICLKEYKDSMNLISNDHIRWFRLRKISTESSRLSYFSKPLEHSASFENLFFDNKDVLLKMLDDFSNKKRKRICLLLHGPPGTGKDSVIVAMARYLSEANRLKAKSKNFKLCHLVAYPLDLFTKSDDFMRVFYGNDKIDGKYIPNEAQIRVFPEAEKYSPIILKKEIKEIINKKTNPEEADKEVFEYIQNNSDMELSKEDFELISMIKTVQNSNNSTKNLLDLKLAPIIESLNSFMDQNQTIVIFTTNVPEECIDETLIRHERLDKFYLGPSSRDSIFKILNYYFKNVPNDVDLSDIPIGKLMPSNVTYYCKISKNYKECIEKMSYHK